MYEFTKKSRNTLEYLEGAEFCLKKATRQNVNYLSFGPSGPDTYHYEASFPLVLAHFERKN